MGKKIEHFNNLIYELESTFNISLNEFNLHFRKLYPNIKSYRLLSALLKLYGQKYDLENQQKYLEMSEYLNQQISLNND